MKKISSVIFSIVAVSSMGIAQSGKLKKADNFYEKVSYAEAALLYTDLLGSEVDSPLLKAKLADCYYQMGETNQAESYYAQMVSSSDVTDEHVYKYAQTLKENGKYTESDTWMSKFHSMKTSDSRGKQFAENKTYVQAIESQGAFFEINHLSINTASSDFGGYPMSENVYFVSNRKKRSGIKREYTWNGKGYLDLYTAKREDDGSLSNPDFQSRGINKKFHEGPLVFSKDGKTVYFTRNNMSGGKKRRGNDGIQNLKMYRATIDENGKWTDEEELAINSKDYSVGHPALSLDGKNMYFASDMPGGFGGADIYKMSINEDGTFGKPENLGKDINTEGQEMFPWFSEEGILFFASDGHLGLGGLDIFAMLPNKNGGWAKRMNVGKPVNSSRDDFAFILNKDQTGYVSSNREGGSGDDDIYSVRLIKPLKVNLSVNGLITDVRSGEIIPGAYVSLIDTDGTVLKSVVVDDKGMYTFDIEPDQNYALEVKKGDYFDNKGEVSTVNLADGQEEIKKDLTLEKDPGLALYTLIRDAKTNQPVEGVTITITDNMSGEEFGSTTTNAAGDFLKGIAGKKIDDRISYNIALSKEGYFPKTVTFNHKIQEPGVINVHELIEGGLALDAEVKDLSELVEISPINFDLGKWNIRPDAKVELDKIVEVMNKYPNMKVELGSHTDCRASKSFNMRLSDKRAKASAKYIQSKITNPERIYGKGYGESRLLNGCECEGPVKSDCSEEEHEKNRRTEFKVISIGDSKVKVINNSSNSFGE